MVGLAGRGTVKVMKVKGKQMYRSVQTVRAMLIGNQETMEREVHFGPQRPVMEHADYDSFIGWKMLTKSVVPDENLPVPRVVEPVGWVGDKVDGRKRLLSWYRLCPMTCS